MPVITIISLGASAVLGLGTLFIAKTVMPNAATAENGSRAVADQVAVVVSTRDVTYGTKLDAGMLTVVQAPASLAPQGAYASVQQVLAADRGGAPVALVLIAAREPLLPAKLSGPGARPSVAAEIVEGMRAYAIMVTDVSGVGGHALPGDRVDVVLTRDLTPEGRERNYISDVVLQNVRVLGVDLNADLDSTEVASPETATLEVTVEDAQKLAVASTLGILSLALRRTGEAKLEKASSMRTYDFLTSGGISRRGGTGARRATYRPMIIVEGHGGSRGRGGRRQSNTTNQSGAPSVPGQPATAPAEA